MPTSEKVRFVLVRLCECEGNERKLVSCHGKLTQRGRVQAVATRNRLCGMELMKWVSPNNTACLETARILADGRPVTVMDEFHEPPYPEWSGLSESEVKQRWPAEFDQCMHPKPGDAARVVVPGGESLRATFERAQSGLERLHEQYAGQGSIGIVSHGEVVRLIVVGLLGSPLENLFKIGGRNGSITVFEYEGAAARFECVNDSSHLAFSEDLGERLRT